MKKEDLEKELNLYKAMYYATKKKLDSLVFNLKKYDYLLPDDYKCIIKAVYEGIKYHD